MTILPIFYGLAAGICLYAAVAHLLIGYRQRPYNKTEISFSIMAFLLAGMIICDAGYRLATTVDNAFKL